MDPLLKQTKGQGDLLFTTKRNDPDNIHVKGKPISFVAMNIPSYMGGRAEPWRQADGNIGLKNPYQKNAPKNYNSYNNLQ